jgi:hypothetical protein
MKYCNWTKMSDLIKTAKIITLSRVVNKNEYKLTVDGEWYTFYPAAGPKREVLKAMIKGFTKIGGSYKHTNPETGTVSDVQNYKRNA